MPTMNCPSCRRAIEVTAEHAGQTIACPYTGCRGTFTVPGQPAPMERAPSFSTSAPTSRREAPGRRSGSDSTMVMILAGIFVCNLLMVGMFAAWEIRYQVFRANMEQGLQELRSKSMRP